jgi:hypothetical protein
MAARLPSLDPLPRNALALVTLAGRTRAEAAARLDIGPEALAVALASGRKELRRSVAPLAASGWCERAELLISDRLDGELDELGAARLDVHLRNCPRCVEHERRLVQALDGLVTGLVGEGAGEPEPAAPPPAPLRLAEARVERAPAPLPHRQPIASAPFGAPVAPASPRAAPAAVPEPAIAAVLEPAKRSARQLVVTGSWHLMFALAVVLAIATIAIAVWGSLGGEL